MSSATLIGEEEGVGRSRRRRADLGSVRFSERDRELLGLIGEQFAVTVEQLAFWSGRSYATARWLRDRWRKAGWVESRQMVPHGPAFVWLTREGTRLAQSPYRTWRPNLSLAGHIEAVTEVRLLLEQRLGLGEWECERSLAKAVWSRSQRRPHLPDAVLETDRGRVAIEVELQRKSRARLNAILGELAQRYPQIWYFAAPGVLPLLRTLAVESAWRNITVHPYPPRPEEFSGWPQEFGR